MYPPINLQALIDSMLWRYICIGLCAVYISAVGLLIAYAYGRKSALPKRDTKGRFAK